MENIPWIFDGIGTAIVTFILGLMAGVFTGYKIAINKSVKQSQRAGNDSVQAQIGQLTRND